MTSRCHPERTREILFGNGFWPIELLVGRRYSASWQLEGLQPVRIFVRPITSVGGSQLKIWIDADAAPRDVKELVFRAAKRLAIETVLVANQRLQTPPGNPLVRAVWVEGGADVADQYIATHASAGDLVVTQDIPLAALLVPKRVAVLDPRGEEHSLDTIGERLSVRDFMDRARMAGAVTGGPPPYDARARQAFAAALDRVLTRLGRPYDGA